MANLMWKGCGGPAAAVRRVQDALNSRMLWPVNTLTRPPMVPLKVDGIFGPKTEAMVREFQRLNRIKADGIIGPVTRLHLFPYLKMSATLKGRGAFVPQEPIYAGQHQPRLLMQRHGTAFGLQPVSDEKPKDEPDKPQGFRFELFVSRGIEVKIRDSGSPQGVWPPRFGPAEQTVNVGAVLLRHRRLELTGELEARKPLKPKSGDHFEWSGFAKLSYEAISPVGPFSPLSPFVQIEQPWARLPGSIGIETKIEILKNILELSVDGQASFGYDWDRGRVIAGGSVSGGLMFNLDILFRKHPPSQP